MVVVLVEVHGDIQVESQSLFLRIGLVHRLRLNSDPVVGLPFALGVFVGLLFLSSC